MPQYVIDEGEPFRPELLLWMDSEGMLIDPLMVRPGELPARICEHLQSLIETHAVGTSQAPTHIRVNAAELADALRAGCPNLEIIHAATPEIDEAIAGFEEAFTEGSDDSTVSYLTGELHEAQVAAFFRAAAGLFRVAPWKAVPCDTAPISITIEALDVRDEVLSIIGQEGMIRGLLLVSSLDQFDVYLNAAYAARHDEEPVFPPHHMLNYERGANTPPAVLEEITKHQWEIAGADAYPWVLSVDQTLAALELTARNLLIIETIALAMTEVLSSEPEALELAWLGEPISRTLSVRTHQGDLEITLRAPYSVAGIQEQASGTVSDLFEYYRLGGTFEIAKHDELQDELIELFWSSPEARRLPDNGICDLISQLAEDYQNATLTTLLPFELESLVFELIPRKLSTDPSEAGSIIEELRCLFAFMKRAYGHKRADACLHVLGGDAVNRLKAALSDPSNFGLAKSLLMSGAEAGFEVDTQEGLDAWTRELNGRPLPGSIHLPRYTERAQPPKAATSAAKKKRKTVKKAIKKARRKNRKR